MFSRQNEAIIILCVQMTITMMGMGLVSPILPQYARSFGVSITMVGLLITSFGVARIIGDLPAGQLAEKFGRRPLLITGPIVLAISSVAAGLADSYWQLVAFRFLQGIGSAMYATAAMIMLADISTPANRGRLMGYYQGSNLIGTGLGPTLGGFIAQYYGLRAPFFGLAFLALLAVLWSYLRIPETRATLSESISLSPNPKPSSAAAWTGLKFLLQDANFILASLVTFGIFFMRTGAQNQLLPLLASDRLGLSAGQIGMALTVMAVTKFAAIFASGKLSDRFGRKKVITPGCLVAVISLVMLSQTYSHWFLLLSCVVMGIGTGISGPTPAAYIADMSRRENYSQAMALYRTIGDLGFVIGPILLGWLADLKGFSFSLLFNSLFLFLAILLFQVFAKERPGYRQRAVNLSKEY